MSEANERRTREKVRRIKKKEDNRKDNIWIYQNMQSKR